MREPMHNFRVGEAVQFTGTLTSLTHERLYHSDESLRPVLNGQVGRVVNESAYGTGYSPTVKAQKSEDNIYPLVLVQFEGIEQPLCLGVNHLVKEEHGGSDTSASRRDAQSRDT